ncbi:putative membrane protein [Acinetobacter baumannii 1293320]|nr:putative membrane protein [Acinetobacter baumannii 1293320]
MYGDFFLLLIFASLQYLIMGVATVQVKQRSVISLATN